MVETPDHDPSTTDRLRSMAREGQSPSAMYHELGRRLGPGAHVLTLLGHFRRAFALSLADAKPIAGLTRNADRMIEDEALFDSLLSPVIAARRHAWDSMTLATPA